MTVRIKGTFIKDRFKHVYILSSFALIPIVINWVVLQWHAAHYNKSTTAFYIYRILLNEFTNMSWLKAINCVETEIIENDNYKKLFLSDVLQGEVSYCEGNPCVFKRRFIIGSHILDHVGETYCFHFTVML